MERNATGRNCRPLVFKMVSSQELISSREGILGRVDVQDTAQDEQHIQQLEAELESMRRMATELGRRELGAHMHGQRLSGELPSAGRASPSTLFAQELERMESGGYVSIRSHLDSPVKSNAIGGKVLRAGQRPRRRHSRPSVATMQSALVLHSARVKRELMNLRAGLASVRAGGTAMSSTLGSTPISSALGVLTSEPEPEAEAEAEAEPQPEPQQEPEPQGAVPAPGRTVEGAKQGCAVTSEAQVRLPQIRRLKRPTGLHDGSSNTSVTRVAGSGTERGGGEAPTRRLTNRWTRPHVASALAPEDLSATPSLPSVHRKWNRDWDRDRSQSQSQSQSQSRNGKRRETVRRHRRRVDTSPVFEGHDSPTLTSSEFVDMATKDLPSEKATGSVKKVVARDLGCFLIPAGKQMRRRHRKPRESMVV